VEQRAEIELVRRRGGREREGRRGRGREERIFSFDMVLRS
jgi:hypothetical protein